MKPTQAAGFVADWIRAAVAAHGAFTCAVSGGQGRLARKAEG